MTRTEMVTELREVLGDTIGTQNWSDSRLTGLLSEGQNKFCEDTGYFTDLTNFTITLSTGVSVYAIDDRVIQIMGIWYGSRKLWMVDTGDKYYDDSIEFTEPTGAPAAWQTDRSTGYVTIYPTPTSEENGDTLTLQVWRYSLYDLAGNGAVPETGPTPLAEPEIPSRFQRACIEWAAFKALSNHDEELQDPIKAADHLVNYKQYVFDGKLALRRIQNIATRVGSDPAYRT